MKISLLLFPILIIKLIKSVGFADPFKALGIPEFKLDFDKPVKRVHTKLESLEDLPRFVQSGELNTNEGMVLLSKFLTEVNKKN